MLFTNKGKLVSVIIPIYNVEKYVRKCIMSIVNQTYKNIEIILVDDGSEDNSGGICDEIASLDSRIIVIHKQNEGVAEARNSGLRKARGEYIYFIDGDDYAEFKAIEILLEYAEKTNADLVIADVSIVDECGKIINYDNDLSNDCYEILNASEAIESFVKNDWSAWNKLYKREIHEYIYFPPNKIHEDEAIMLQILFNCKRIVHLHYKLYNYVKRGNSITSSEYSIRKLDWYEAWVRNVEFISINYPQSLNKAIAKMVMTAIYNFDNLLKINNELYIEIFKTINNYLGKIIWNKEIIIQYKIRVIVMRISIKLYKKLYVKKLV